MLAGVFFLVNLAFLVYGVTNPALTGYGTTTDLYIGFGVLVGSLLLFVFRRVVQDKKPITFRDPTPTMPSPEQMALLQEECRRSRRLIAAVRARVDRGGVQELPGSSVPA